jgi:hypothetical protein
MVLLAEVLEAREEFLQAYRMHVVVAVLEVIQVVAEQAPMDLLLLW